MTLITGQTGESRFGALAIVMVLALATGPSLAGQKKHESRTDRFKVRPKAQFVVEGVPVFSVVPPDVIAAIDDPVMVPAGDVTGIMGDDEPVLGVSRDGMARAYSTWMLDFHEVVNDRLGSVPIAATWCPLANTGVVYVRLIDGEETSFGVTGSLWHDSLVLFDRKTSSYWSQVTGIAIHGPLRDRRLTEIPSVTTTWGAWRHLHPETLVLRPDDQSRGGSPFAQYFEDPNRFGITKSLKPDRRLPGKSLVVGVHDAGVATALPVGKLAEHGIVQGWVGETPLVILSVATRSGFAYDRSVSSGTLDFETVSDGGLRDRQTGSSWDRESGTALDGPLMGVTLRRLHTRSGYWFTWASFHPSTEILALDDHGAGRAATCMTARPLHIYGQTAVVRSTMGCPPHP